MKKDKRKPFLSESFLSDGTVLNVILVGLALIAGNFLSGLKVNEFLLGVLLSLLIIFLSLVLIRLSKVKNELADLKSMLENFTLLGGQSGSICSLNKFVNHEQSMADSDTVLVYVSTLDYELGSFYQTILDNLNNGVNYYYIVAGDELTKRDWKRFVEKLNTGNAKTLPQSVIDPSQASAWVWNTAIYCKKQKEGVEEVTAFSVLSGDPSSSSCMQANPIVAEKLRNQFWATWKNLHGN